MAGRSARAALTAALLAVPTAAALALAAPADAATVLDCTPMGDPACKNLVAVAQCAWNNGDGTTTVVWGYRNPSGVDIRIDFGAHNGMSPGPYDQGQPTLFPAGTYTNVATTTVTGTSALWRLGNSNFSTDTTTPACASKPVSVIGSVPAAVATAAVAVLAALATLTLRRRKGATSA